MNSPNGNIYTASGVALGQKVRVCPLGKGTRLNSKLHSPSQADRHWKPINAFTMRLRRKMGEAHSIGTQVGPKHWDLCIGNWNVT